MANRSVRRFPARRASSLKTWAGLSSGTTWGTLAANSSVLIGSFITNFNDETLLRTRGELAILSDGEVEEEIQGALGMAVVSRDAFGIGITAVPLPINDIDNDSWVVWAPYHHARALGTASGQSPAETKLVIDSKAMRKIHGEQNLVVVLQNENTSFGLRFHLTVRVLARTGAGA